LASLNDNAFPGDPKEQIMFAKLIACSRPSKSLRVTALIALACSIPALAAAQGTAVEKLTVASVGQPQRLIYIKAMGSTQVAAEHAAASACAMERRDVRSGSVASDRSHCESASLAEFELARSASLNSKDFSLVGLVSQ
jgi:hypothetical protein